VLAIVLWEEDFEVWVLAWNVLGALLLLNIVSVAIAAFAVAFGTDHVNEWVLHVPFVWLPAVLVQTALFGHVVVFRRLRLGADPRLTLTSESAAERR
jgi:ABC-type branched-subunit amino acid transport system permease subunit